MQKQFKPIHFFEDVRTGTRTFFVYYSTETLRPRMIYKLYDNSRNDFLFKIILNRRIKPLHGFKLNLAEN